MRLLSFLISLSVFSLLIWSCKDSPTQIERFNKYDPENTFFTVQPIKSISSTINAYDEIEVSWVDNSSYTSYYLLYKSFNNESKELIDTVFYPNKTYIDDSKNIRKNTTYSLVKVYLDADKEEKKSKLKSTKLTIPPLEITYSDSVIDGNNYVVANFENPLNLEFIAYVDFLYNRTSVTDTLVNPSKYISPIIERNFAEKQIWINVYLDERDVEDDILFTNSDKFIFSSAFGSSPVLQDVEIVHEGKTVLNWTDNSDFEDGFIVYRGHSQFDEAPDYFKRIADLAPNTTSFIDTLSPFLGYQRNSWGGLSNTNTFYYILALKDETQSRSNTIKKSIDIPSPQLSFQQIDDQTVQLNWEASNSKISKFILQKKAFNNGSFYDYKILDADVRSFTDTNLDTIKTYNYRIKTLSSKPSNGLRIDYVSTLEQQNFIMFTGARNVRFSDSGNLVVISGGSYKNDDPPNVAVYDLINKEYLYFSNPFDTPIMGVDINESKNEIAVVSVENKTITTINYLTKSLLYEANNRNAYDLEYSPDNRYLYTVGKWGQLGMIDLSVPKVMFQQSSGSTTGTLTSISVSSSGDTVAYTYNGSFKLSEPTKWVGQTYGLPTGGRVSQFVQFSKKGNYVAVISNFRHAFLVDINTMSIYHSVHGVGANFINISHNENYFFTSNNDIRQYNLQTKLLEGLYKVPETVQFMRPSPTRNEIAVSTSKGVYILRASSAKIWQDVKN